MADKSNITDKVQVLLKYPSVSRIEVRKTVEISAGYTVGELTSSIISDYEDQQGIKFTGANILTLVNGRLAAPDTALCGGDDVKIIPVAAGG